MSTDLCALGLGEFCDRCNIMHKEYEYSNDYTCLTCGTCHVIDEDLCVANEGLVPCEYCNLKHSFINGALSFCTQCLRCHKYKRGRPVDHDYEDELSSCPTCGHGGGNIGGGDYEIQPPPVKKYNTWARCWASTQYGGKNYFAGDYNEIKAEQKNTEGRE